MPENATETVGADSTVLRMEHRVGTPVDGERVSFTTTYIGSGWEHAQRSRSTLRFLGAEALSTFLSEAGFAVHERFGDWDRSPFTPASPEIIVAAGRVQRQRELTPTFVALASESRTRRTWRPGEPPRRGRLEWSAFDAR